MFSYIVLGHYPVTNSSGMHLKLNCDFSCCKTVVLTVLKGLSGTNVSNISKTCCIVSYLLWELQVERHVKSHNFGYVFRVETIKYVA